MCTSHNSISSYLVWRVSLLLCSFLFKTLLLILVPWVLFIVSLSWFPPLVPSSVCTEHNKSEKNAQYCNWVVFLYMEVIVNSASRFVIHGEGMERGEKKQERNEWDNSEMSIFSWSCLNIFFSTSWEKKNWVKWWYLHCLLKIKWLCLFFICIYF